MTLRWQQSRLIPSPHIGYAEKYVYALYPQPRYGCQAAPLMASIAVEDNEMAGPVEITAANFEAEVLKSTTPVLIDFWAPWCGPCRMVAPSVEEMATQYAGKLKVGKLNVDDHPSVAQRYNITGIPALLFFESGQVVETVVGAVPKSALQKKVDEVLAKA